MTTVIRLGFIKIANNSKPLLATPKQISQKCFISGKTLRKVEKLEKPAAWPYKQKNYGLINAIFDKTTRRFDENSKIICVEGPIGAGKTKFAQELAEELEMLYMPAVTMDMHYINAYGYDLRQLDPQLPEDLRSYDEKNFCQNPNHRSAANFQIMKYQLRFSQYLDALAHLLNTGQGVILNRSVYSDFVFLEAMVNAGFISKGAKSVYYDIKKNTITELLKPHLIIYLDVPVPIVQKRIKERNLEYEVNSKAFTDSYLSSIEKHYKQDFLKEFNKHSELLVYDWSNYGDTEVVVEDIERIDFYRYDRDDPKFKDWKIEKEWDWAELRMYYTNDKDQIMNFFHVPRFDVPELVADPYDMKKWKEVMETAPGMKYRYGYNAEMGDKGIITKMSLGN